MALAEPIQFADGADFDGQTVSTASWALLLIAPDDDASLKLAGAEQSATKFTQLWSEYNIEPNLLYGQSPLATNSQAAETPSFNASGNPRGWASLYLEGTLTIESLGLWELRADHFVTDEPLTLWPSGPMWPIRNGNGWKDHEGLRGMADPIAVRLTANDAVAEYTGWAWSCGACPPTAGNTEGTVPAAGGGWSSGRIVEYVRLDVHELSLQGRVFGIAFGSETTDIDVPDGSVRLPLSHLRCEGCPPAVGGTVAIKGDFALHGIRWDSGRALFGGGLTLHNATVQVDEQPAVRIGRDSQAALAAGAATAIFVALFLISRQLLAQPLEHDIRRSIADTINAHGGLAFSEIRHRLGLANGQLSYHLFVMRKAHVLRRTEVQGRDLYILAAQDTQRTRREAVLRQPGVPGLYDWIQRHPGLRQTALVAAAASWGESRSATQRKLRRLVASGLVTATNGGYTTNPPHRTPN